MVFFSVRALSFLFFFTSCFSCLAQEQTPKVIVEVIELWKKGAPGFEKLKKEPENFTNGLVRHVNNPSLVVYKPAPELANGVAIIIAPGGAHEKLTVYSEGRDPAEFFNQLGITAYVLKYRLAREPNSPYSLDIHPQEDAYRALRTLRYRAKELHLDPNKIGIMGFSAGGEVVAKVAYGSGEGNPKAKDPIDRENGKPNFQILVYPGPLFVPETLPADAPPAFMVAAIDDACCSNPIVQLTKLYHDAKIPAEVHLYAQGGHAFTMGQRSKLKSVHSWSDRLVDWMIDSQIITAAKTISP